jgi:hypothetical protein
MRSVLQRFTDKTMYCGDCIAWTASTNAKGYGTFRMGKKRIDAHKVAYLLFVGPVPEGKELDHVCRNTRWVNTAHLQPVTRSLNIARIYRPYISADRVDMFCFHGHEMVSLNTYIDRTGKKHCRMCVNNRTKKYQAKLKGEST